MNDFLCTQCYPDHKEIGSIADGIYVVVDKYGMYSLAWGQYGHRGCLYQFQTKPYPDPLENLTDDEINNMPDQEFKQFGVWVHKAEIDSEPFLKWLGSIDAALSFASDLIVGGYKRKENGFIWFYLFCKTGEIIKNYEALKQST